jgi:hypothetical protein
LRVNKIFLFLFVKEVAKPELLKINKEEQKIKADIGQGVNITAFYHEESEVKDIAHK